MNIRDAFRFADQYIRGFPMASMGKPAKGKKGKAEAKAKGKGGNGKGGAAAGLGREP